MVQKSNKYTLKFCKFYEEDVFGRYAIRPKKTHKSLNIVYSEILRYNKKLRNLYKLYLKLFYTLKSNLYILRKLFFKNKKKKRNQKFGLILHKLRQNILLTIKSLKENRKIFSSNIGKFNYRVDIGKPSRKKRKITRFSIRLLTRHKLSNFSARIPVYQFKKYLKQHRNYKYFSMNFLFTLESRVDVILYRLNFSHSPGYIRQFIKHHGVLVNNKTITTPSYRLSLSDNLSFKNKKEIFNKIYYNFIKRLVFMSIPVYYEVNFRLLIIKFFLIPRLNMLFYPFQVDKLRLSSFGKHF